MDRIPCPGASVRPASADALQRHYGARWAISFDHLHAVWYAERRSGTALHILAAYQPHELAARIEAAESRDGAGARWVTAASGPDRREDDGQAAR